MPTLLGIIFSTDEKFIAYADVKLLGSTVESPVIEFDQEKYEKLLSSGVVSPKALRHYHKVSTETHSQVSSKTSQRRTSLEFSRANGLNSLKALIASRGVGMVRVNASQETPVMTHGQDHSRDQSHCNVSLRPC